jgi:ABC-2 type transport system permease protein
MAAAGFAGDSPLFLLDFLLRFLRVALLLSLWRSILAHGGAVPGMAPGVLLTYTLVGEAFAEPLACRTDLGTSLWDGSIATRMLRPQGIAAQFGTEALGRWAVGFGLFSLPLFLAAPLLGVDPLPASPLHGLCFVASLVLAVGVGLALELAAGALMVAFDQNVWAFNQVRSAVSVLLSGALLPLAALPWGLGRVFEWLPFASMASAPLRIYTGTGSPAGLLALQAAWCLALWPAARWLWRKNQEQLVCHGG